LIWIKEILLKGSSSDKKKLSGDTVAESTDPVPDTLMRRRRMEIFAFLFLTAVLMPALAVATVGTYGLSVWIYQIINGPPGPPPPR
jgi:periplasmic nitrate reductase NapE